MAGVKGKSGRKFGSKQINNPMPEENKKKFQFALKLNESDAERFLSLAEQKEKSPGELGRELIINYLNSLA